MVQTTTAKNDLLANGVPAANIVCLDEQPAGSFQKVLLAVFEGCVTAYQNVTWGSPTDGVVAKGADCALGFTTKIFSHHYDQNGLLIKGAEEWADAFWQGVAAGKTVSVAASDALSGIPPIKGLGSQRVVGGINLKIIPARYGQ